MGDAYIAARGLRMAPVGAFLFHLASIEWASRHEDIGITSVLLTPEEATVGVGVVGRHELYGPFSFDVQQAELLQRLVHPSGLSEPMPGAPVPIFPEAPASWRHSWAELLQDLGQHVYGLRDLHASLATLRYERIDVGNSGRYASVGVVDAKSQRWITHLSLDPPSSNIMTAPFDIASWILRGDGETLEDGSKIFQL